MKIQITMEPDSEFVDAAHPSGLTEDGQEQITDALMGFGTQVEIDRVE